MFKLTHNNNCYWLPCFSSHGWDINCGEVNRRRSQPVYIYITAFPLHYCKNTIIHKFIGWLLLLISVLCSVFSWFIITIVIRSPSPLSQSHLALAVVGHNNCPSFTRHNQTSSQYCCLLHRCQSVYKLYINSTEYSCAGNDWNVVHFGNITTTTRTITIIVKAIPVCRKRREISSTCQLQKTDIACNWMTELQRRSKTILFLSFSTVAFLWHRYIASCSIIKFLIAAVQCDGHNIFNVHQPMSQLVVCLIGLISN